MAAPLASVHNMGAFVSDITEAKKSGRITVWLVSIIAALVAFYLMNHAVMGLQGLPLDWNLTPAQ